MSTRDAIVSRYRYPLGRKRIGQSMLEFAIVILVALVLIFGIIQASLALYAYNFVSYAARSAVRYAMVHGSQSGSPATASTIQSYAKGLASGLDPHSLTVTTTWNPNNNPGSTVTVKVTYEFRAPIPFIWTRVLILSSTAQGVITN